MSILNQVIDAAADAAARSSAVDARAWQLYHQWRGARLADGALGEIESIGHVMAECFDEAEVWLKLAEERRRAES